MARAEDSRAELDEKVWFTVREAATYLEVSEPTIYRWMREGKLSFYKVGDSTRFKKENLDMVFEKHTAFAEAEGRQTRCLSCGHSVLVPGKVQSTGNIYFRPEHTKFFVLLESYVKTRAAVCPRCGFIQVFADTEKLNRLLPDDDPARS